MDEKPVDLKEFVANVKNRHRMGRHVFHWEISSLVTMAEGYLDLMKRLKAKLDILDERERDRDGSR